MGNKKKNPLEKYSIKELIEESMSRTDGLVAAWMNDEGGAVTWSHGDDVARHGLASLLRLTIDRQTEWNQMR